MSLLAKTKSDTAKNGVVDVAGRWGEGYYSYPGRSDMLVCQKSAEAILAG
jgi:hypothetical protein